MRVIKIAWFEFNSEKVLSVERHPIGNSRYRVRVWMCGDGPFVLEGKVATAFLKWWDSQDVVVIDVCQAP